MSLDGQRSAHLRPIFAVVMDITITAEPAMTEQRHNPDLESDLEPGFEPLRTCFVVITVLLGLLVCLF